MSKSSNLNFGKRFLLWADFLRKASDSVVPLRSVSEYCPYSPKTKLIYFNWNINGGTPKKFTSSLGTILTPKSLPKHPNRHRSFDLHCGDSIWWTHLMGPRMSFFSMIKNDHAHARDSVPVSILKMITCDCCLFVSMQYSRDSIHRCLSDASGA